MAAVNGLGYVLVEATDLDAWHAFACDLLGLQAAVREDNRLVLRLDEKAYRLDIRRSETDRVTALGWQVKGPNELEELVGRLESAGFAVKRADAELTRERQVMGLVSFTDPEGQELELFYGLQKHADRFASPTGARFVTGEGEMGHAFQMVHDNEAYNRLYLDVLGFKLSDYIHFGDSYGTFTHANSRHHTFAWAPIPFLPPGVAHLMFEVDDLDLVGRAWDKVQAGAAPVASTFGKHTNDEMLSFYVKSPSGFQIEYGYGGRSIDDATWSVESYDRPSYWGHKMTDPNEPEI